MGSYMSSEPPTTPWKILHSEVIKLGEDFEVEMECEEGAHNIQYQRCQKNPNHTNMVAMSKLSLGDIPAPYREPKVYNDIMYHSRRVVKINAPYVSPNRPRKYPLSRFRGMHAPHCGTGLFCGDSSELLKQGPIDCPLSQCRPHPHKVTPIFQITTAIHVVYDNIEAQKATVTFFYDSEGSETVTGEVVHVLQSHKENDDIILRCVSHDLELFSKILKGQFIPSPSRPHPHLQPRKRFIVIISHPHGHHKHVSFGEWVGYKPHEERTYSRDMFSNMKLSDFVRLLGSMCPTIRETGGYFGANTFFSREQYRELEQQVQQNPNATMRDVMINGIETRDPYRFLSFITYTTATCPGSSGAPVFVLCDSDDGTARVNVLANHFRQHTKKSASRQWINASGGCGFLGEELERFNHYKQFLKREV